MFLKQKWQQACFLFLFGLIQISFSAELENSSSDLLKRENRITDGSQTLLKNMDDGLGFGHPLLEEKKGEQEPNSKKKKKRRKRIDRNLLIEKMENPLNEDLYSGKMGIDSEYHNLINEQKSMKDKIDKSQAKLYSYYRTFESAKNKMKIKRNKKLKRLLEASTVENFFMENDESNPSENKKKFLEVTDAGLIVKDPVKDKKQRRLMGMRNLKDFKNLDIVSQIKKRHKELHDERKEDFEKNENQQSFNASRNLKDEQITKEVKHVNKNKEQSFFLRNDYKNQKSSFFQPERSLSLNSKKNQIQNKIIKTTENNSLLDNKISTLSFPQTICKFIHIVFCIIRISTYSKSWCCQRTSRSSDQSYKISIIK